MTRSALASPDQSVVPVTSRSVAKSSRLSSLRRFTFSSSSPRTMASDLPTSASSRSRSLTGTPALTVTKAMPLPMKPPPSIPTRSTLRGWIAGSSTPRSFLSAVEAKKISTSRRETSVTASSPKRFASSASPSSMPCAKPCAITSSARSGAG